MKRRRGKMDLRDIPYDVLSSLDQDMADLVGDKLNAEVAARLNRVYPHFLMEYKPIPLDPLTIVLDFPLEEEGAYGYVCTFSLRRCVKEALSLWDAEPMSPEGEEKALALRRALLEMVKLIEKTLPNPVTEKSSQ